MFGVILLLLLLFISNLMLLWSKNIHRTLSSFFLHDFNAFKFTETCSMARRRLVLVTALHAQEKKVLTSGRGLKASGAARCLTGWFRSYVLTGLLSPLTYFYLTVINC